EAAIHGGRNRIRVVASRIDDGGVCARFPERPHGGEASGSSETHPSEARIRTDGLKLAHLVDLIEPSETVGHEGAIELHNPIEVVTIQPASCYPFVAPLGDLRRRPARPVHGNTPRKPGWHDGPNDEPDWTLRPR